ncbi:MAG: RNA polymerase factor sigma-54 [Planctomycetaceae bacterium]|nr:RNA polymerase factor sigma-54 [Planctomycetaceae bacterium]
MHLNFSQQMRLSQQMKLAPRMIQSMEILQLPLMALQERIEQEMLENIALEKATDEPEETGDFAAEDNGAAEENLPTGEVEQRELNAGNEDNNASDFERLAELSQDWPEDNYTSGSKPSGNQQEDAEDRQHDLMANAENPPQTLHESLMDQFHYFDCAPAVRAFGEYLIQNLNHNGWLQSSLPEIVQVYGGTVSLPEAEEALRLIQRLDPPGVGARDLKECLLLQITPHTPLHSILVTLIGSHWEDLLNNRLPQIERKTGYSIDDIKAAMEELKHLNFAPGRGFEQVQTQSVTPDLAVEQNEHGAYVVRLIDEYIPQLRISRRYVQMLEGNPDAATKEFIRRKIESARWLIESIEQRYNTLKRVAQAIVDKQIDFLENGPEHIVPLKMQQIADVVGVHVTTVSRAVDGKHIATPRGIFPLKRFFGGGTTTAEGEEVAWDIVRLKLKELVDNEDKSDPLSDDALVDEMAKLGYTLARRTVTKYRKALNIPSSRQRKQF